MGDLLGQSEVMIALGLLQNRLYNVVVLIDAETLTVQQIVAFGPLQVPKLVEEGVVSLLLKSLDHGVQIAFGFKSFHLIAMIVHFDVNYFLSGLNGPLQL